MNRDFRTDDFYIGYLPKAPESLAKILVRIVTALTLLGLLVGVLLVLGQSPFAASKFEYGQYREYDGVLEKRPYPVLLTRDSRFLLVAAGKHGLAETVQGMEGNSVRLKGSLIQRGPDAVLEVLPGSLQASLSGIPNTSRLIDLGPIKLTGEIVDSKCYLGVMNPGNGKVHRDCASRCLSGGIPPLFIEFDNGKQFLLVAEDGRALPYNMFKEFIAEPLNIRGDLVQRGDEQLLKIDPRQLWHSD